MNNENYNFGQIILLFFICGLLAMLCSCRSHKCLIEESDRLVDSIYITNYEHDSIYLRDSIYHEVTVQGDSIVVLKERWHTAYRDRLKVDTLVHNVTDTITKTLLPVEIEKKLSWWDELLITFAQFAFYMIIAVVIIYAAKFIK